MKQKNLPLIKHTLFYTWIRAYLLFLVCSFLSIIIADVANLYSLLPLLILLIFLFSLLPAAVFWLKIYRPLEKIIQAAVQYSTGSDFAPLDYSEDNELGLLAASVNHLAESTCNAEEYRRNFISNISHDFRSPLTSIKGYVAAILDGTIPCERQEKYLRIVFDETEHLHQLVENLMTINKYRDNGIHLEQIDFDLVPIIKSTIGMFDLILSKRQITIRSEFCDNSVMVHADITRIQHVLYILLDNAVKFSPDESLIEVRVTDQKSRVLVSVRDNGSGIPKDSLDKIWKIFYKTDTSRSRDRNSIGIGLPVARDIIHAHGQNIDVVSTEGVRSEFIFTLERAQL